MKQLIVVITSLLIFMNVVSAEQGTANIQIIKAAGIELYPSAEFINGSREVGYRFATSKSPGEVRVWYRQQLSGWAVYEEFGGWIIYNGKPGIDIGDLMSVNQVAVKENKMLHEWFGTNPALNTEILIMIPGQ